MESPLTHAHCEQFTIRIAKPPPEADLALGEAEAFKHQIEALKTQSNVVAIVSGMKEFATHSGVRKHVCAALWSLAKEKATKTAIGKAGGCDGILTAVQRHSKDSDVLDQGLGALWSLAGEAQNRVLIVKLGV